MLRMAAAIVPRTRWRPQAERHLARVTKTIGPKINLPARPARLVVEFWLHAGYY